MPLAVSATTLSGRSTAASTNERTWSAKSPQQVERLDGRRAGRRPAGTPGAAIALISARPVSSPTGGPRPGRA